MKNYLVLLLIIFTVEGYAQKCETKKDPFTGEEVVEYDFGKKVVKFRTENEKIYLEMKFQYYGEQNVMISKGTDFFIKLKNEEVLKLKTTTNAAPMSRIAGSYIMTLYTYQFEISKKELTQLVNSEATMIRYPNPNGETLDFKLTGGNARIKKHLSKGSSCIFDNLKF